MEKPSRIWKDIYIIGSDEISHPHDCCVYLLDAGDLVLIDTGAGKSFNRLVANMESLGFSPERLKAILVTHAHIDHIGSLNRFRQTFGVQTIAHEMDAWRIESGKGVGAEAYGVVYMPCPVDLKLTGSEESLSFGPYQLEIIHIPGHTPGSIVAYIDIDEKRILFGQDIHGPYYTEWGADPVLARESLQKLVDLRADILCEGHFGIYQPRETVERYIKGYINLM
ncbi:MBL fold metallo-hydrolase [Chloroflexota bacterium]